MRIRFTQATRKHRIGRSSARHVLANATPTPETTHQGNLGWRYVGLDDRGRELEIVAVEVTMDADPEGTLLVLHVMPTQFREKGS